MRKKKIGLLKNIKMIFWDIPVYLPKQEYGGLIFLLLVFPWFFLATNFIYRFQTEDLNPCLEFEYETVCSGAGDAYECHEEILCVTRESDYTSTSNTKLWFEAQKASYIFIGAYILVPFLIYLLWMLTSHWFEQITPKFHRFFTKRWSELIVVFFYFNFMLSIIKGFISYF